MITPDTDAVICNHVSNVFGFVQPVEEIAALCRAAGRSPDHGRLPVGRDAAAGHDGPGGGLCRHAGPQGTLRPAGNRRAAVRRRPTPATLLEGGTGSLSIQQEMPDFLPDRLEAGTHNMPGIAGLLAGVRFVRRQGLDAICDRERRLALLAAEGLRPFPACRSWPRRTCTAQAGVLSFTADGWDVEAAGRRLGRAGHRRPGGTSLRAPGPPHRRDAGHRTRSG